MKHIITIIALILTLNLHADTRRVFLGNLDLAGLVPESLPQPGTRLSLENPEQPLTTEHQENLGYLPVLFRKPIQTMQAKGLPIHLEVEHVYESPQPGRFLRVTLWADTQDLSLIEPLIYDIPIHSKDDLSDYE